MPAYRTERIKDFPAESDPALTDVLPVDGDDGNRKVTLDDLITKIADNIDALASLNPVNGLFRVKDGKYFQILNSTTGLWHTVFLSGVEGQIVLNFGPGEA